MADRLFLVTIFSDPRIRRLLWRPVTMIACDEHGFIEDVELIEKPAILCDACGCRVAVRESELGELPTGYALCDEKFVIEVVCEDCRRKYFKHLKVYRDLDEALGGEG